MAFTPQLPLLAISMGDPAGIGPEVVLKALHHRHLLPQARYLVLGDPEVLAETAQALKLPQEILAFTADQPALEHDFAQSPAIPVLQTGPLDRRGFALGKAHAGAGELAYQTILKGVALAQAGLVDALVTGPICKESLHLAGHFEDGHTGLIARLTNCTNYRMTFCTDKLKIMHVTAHLSLQDAIERITTDRVLETIRLGDAHLKALGLTQRRIAVCGLNPHAGEQGIFGREDLDQILPAVTQAQAEGIQAEGPLPADATFMRAFRGAYDLVVAQYHDQGHIPGKLVAFETGVNVTVGLPIVRTSVDHGTAFDIAGKGVAGYENLYHALSYALAMLARR